MLDNKFDHQKLEKFWYDVWEKSGYFSCNVKSENDPYTIMMPPPNVTGNLHIGHALTFTLQDILIRFYRRIGFDTLWQPGMDHAGIATQMVVERQLSENNISRRVLGREKFIEKIWDWKNQSGGMITSQLRALGASPDWSRERFTMDEGLSQAVRKVFVELFKEGLIYRDKRLVNWDPKLLTAISDLEVENIEKKSKLWYIKYPIQSKKNFIIVATTRPETMLGDSGIAVHPDDQRYIKLIGMKAILPLVGRKIPIIADEYSDPGKGSGAVKITPAHDFNDFEVGKKHKLKLINIFDEKANIVEMDEIKEYQGLSRFEAREKIVSELSNLGLIEKVETIQNTLPYGDRSGVIIEPWLMDQWYVNAKVLAKPTIEAVRSGKMKFIPKNWENTFYDWMENIQPWCISRQLWWGHRIPVWYGPDGKVFVEETEEKVEIESLKHYGKKVTLKQDEDVLDTWFSSALWPFSTLGWPEKTSEILKYYPGSVLVTGFDIIFFWVARMMMMGMHFMKDVPFKDIYIHALVRDEKGQKMSKSKGNVMDPLDISKKYGADALRFTLAAMAAQGRDVKLSESRIAGYRNFSTKIWNAAKFLEMNKCNLNNKFHPDSLKQNINIWIVSQLQITVNKVEKGLKAYRFNDAADSIYKFIWNTYCDWYLELIKPSLSNQDNSLETKETACWVLFQANNLLNPFMPFITEELNKELFKRLKMQLNGEWPVVNLKIKTDKAILEISFLINLLIEIRSIKSILNVPASTKPKLLLKNLTEQQKLYINKYSESILKIAKLDKCELIEGDFPHGSAQGLVDGVLLALPLKDIINLDNEKARLEKEKVKMNIEIEKLQFKLNNDNFIEKAPSDVVEGIKMRLKEYQNKKSSVLEAMNRVL